MIFYKHYDNLEEGIEALKNGIEEYLNCLLRDEEWGNTADIFELLGTIANFREGVKNSAFYSEGKEIVVNLTVKNGD